MFVANKSVVHTVAPTVSVSKTLTESQRTARVALASNVSPDPAAVFIVIVESFCLTLLSFTK